MTYVLHSLLKYQQKSQAATFLCSLCIYDQYRAITVNPLETTKL